jgi:hypothetical protein
MLIFPGHFNALWFRVFRFRNCDNTALHMAVGTDRRAKKTTLRLDQPLPLQPISNVMSFNPPNHSPGVDGHGSELSSAQSPTDHLEFKNTLTGSESTIQTHQHLSKKRRSSKSKIPGELRRSTSTPHMRNLAVGTSGELSPTSNKARNKLGYHRTSVACGMSTKAYVSCVANWTIVTNTNKCRTLPTEKDSMSTGTGRSTGSLFELHSIEERVQLLPSGT